jgi:hypothetical protein
MVSVLPYSCKRDFAVTCPVLQLARLRGTYRKRDFLGNEPEISSTDSVFRENLEQVHKAATLLVFGYSSLLLFHSSKHHNAMTPTIAAAVPRSFVAERMEYQFMLAMLPHDYRLTHFPETRQRTDHRSNEPKRN